ncbi:MAG: DUF6293 family protein [Thermoplasmata archaeon]
MLNNLRVHISPVGFQSLRITEPLIKMQADKVYLVTYRDHDDANFYFEKVKSELKNKYKHIGLEIIYLDLWDLNTCIEAFREIFVKEKGNHVYFNVSTGTKITAIAGTISCMLWGGIPYYVPISYKDMAMRNQDATEITEEPQILPVQEIRKPRGLFLKVLEILESAGGIMKKKQLIKKLEELDVIKPRDENRKGLTPSAEHSQLKAILDPMEKDWHYVKVDSRGRRSEVMILEQGKSALKIFGPSELYTS